MHSSSHGSLSPLVVLTSAQIGTASNLGSILEIDANALLLLAFSGSPPVALALPFSLALGAALGRVRAARAP